MGLKSAAMEGELDAVRRILDRISLDPLDLKAIQVISWVTYQWPGMERLARAESQAFDVC